MVPEASPEILLVKVPEPVPSVVLLFEIVGFVVVAQQTPFADIVEPPSLVTVPPLVAVVLVIAVMAVVVTTGASARVVNASWPP